MGKVFNSKRRLSDTHKLNNVIEVDTHIYNKIFIKNF